MDMIIDILKLTAELSIPIVLGAMCGTIAERGGVILLGVEGIMLMGAFGGALGSHLAANAGVGFLFSMIIGGLIGFLYCALCIKFHAHQSVIGVGVNMLASGLTAVLLKEIWGKEGMSDTVATISNIDIPILSRIPVIGRIFQDQSPYLLLMLFIVFAVWFVMCKTKFGLRYRAIGDHPRAVQTSGINVNRYRYIALTIAGMIAGLGGSYLSISQNNLFVVDMTAGRGFMGLAANIFGGWQPLGSLGAGLIFAVAQSARYYLSDLDVPLQFIQMIPYVSTLIVLLYVGKRAKAPEALGELVD